MKNNTHNLIITFDQVLTGTFNKNGPQYFSYTIKTNKANSLKFAGDVTDL